MIATSCLLAYFTCYFKELQDFRENFARDFCDPELVKIYCALQPKNCCLSKRSGGTSPGVAGLFAWRACWDQTNGGASLQDAGAGLARGCRLGAAPRPQISRPVAFFCLPHKGLPDRPGQR